MKYGHIQSVVVRVSMTLDEIETLEKCLQECITRAPENSNVYYQKKALRELKQAVKDACTSMQFESEHLAKKMETENV